MTKKQLAERDEYRAKLLEMLKPGDTVYTVLRSVSRSGMYRTLDVYAIQNNEPMRLTWWVATAVEMRYDQKREALGVGGCGMDVGFEVVYNLGAVLWPNGFECIGEGAQHRDRCPSNDHSNGDRDYSPHPHSSGGYALRHRWLV
jgi:hypothetical protein